MSTSSISTVRKPPARRRRESPAKRDCAGDHQRGIGLRECGNQGAPQQARPAKLDDDFSPKREWIRHMA